MSEEETYQRLSDKILDAFNLALEQEDINLSELLSRALELSLTRGAGGTDFVERREFSDEIEAALNKFDALRSQSQAS